MPLKGQVLPDSSLLSLCFLPPSLCLIGTSLQHASKAHHSFWSKCLYTCSFSCPNFATTNPLRLIPLITQASIEFHFLRKAVHCLWTLISTPIILLHLLHNISSCLLFYHCLCGVFFVSCFKNDLSWALIPLKAKIDNFMFFVTSLALYLSDHSQLHTFCELVDKWG